MSREEASSGVAILREKHREGVGSWGNGGSLSMYFFVEIQLEGARDKKCKCEHCDLTFVYPMRREVVGRAETLWGMFPEWTRRRARRQAVAALERALVVECDAIPCLGCGKYQEQMCRRMFTRKNYHDPRKKWNQFVLFGALFAVVGASCGVFGFALHDGSREVSAVVVFGIAAILLTGLILLAVGISGLARHARQKEEYDPYQWSTHEERLRLARELSAVTLDEYRAAKKQGLRLQHPSERQVVPPPYLPSSPPQMPVPYLPPPPPPPTPAHEGENPFDFR